MENQRINVLIGDDSALNGVRAAATLRENSIYAYTRKKNGRVILDSILSDKPDVVVTDLTLPDTDAVLLMRKAKESMTEPPAFIVITDIENSFIRRQVIENGASHLFPRPVEPAKLVSAIRAVYRTPMPSDCEDKELIVTDVIQKLGIPAHIKGYNYLRTAILSSIDNIKLMDCITKGLYPCVAKHYDTTASRVERAIRHAIETAWNRGSTETFADFFGNSVDIYRTRPTNSEFIALVTDKIRLKLKKYNR